MSDLKKAILNKVVRPHTVQNFDTVLATVYSYDNVKNRANVSFQDPNGVGFINAENVPVQLSGGGIKSSGPFPGDQVVVTFANKSPLSPKITALVDEQYQVATRQKTKHLRKGAFLPTSYSKRENLFQEETLNIDTPTIDDWVDETNEDDAKYVNYIEVNALENLKKETNSAGYYKTAEVGLVHPSNTSVVKIRDDGMIDIFVRTNQGIRVDPVTQTLNFFSNHEKHNVTDFSMFSDNDVKIESKKKFDIVSKAISFSGDSMSIATSNGSIDLGDKWVIKASCDIEIQSESSITLKAKDTLTLDAADLHIYGDLSTIEEF